MVLQKSQKIVVVTGGTRGIGYGTVKVLAETLPNDVIYMTGRDIVFGERVLKKLDCELMNKKHAEIRLHPLDITDEESCQIFAEHLEKEHGGLDILINNAGFAYKNNDPTPLEIQAEVTLNINYYGTKRITDYLAPIMRQRGRIINICSQAGVMRGAYKNEYIDLVASPTSTYEDVDKLIEIYKEHCKKGLPVGDGTFAKTAYSVSKALEIALTMIQAREFKAKKILVNCCCPGAVATRMTGFKGIFTPERGADCAVYLATARFLPSGMFFYLRKPIDWP
ncbi:unnamed protein product [Bursaphelenchus xylophilus]|uniref:(pine wood nematode) hypothetical protein n=1 Tax=Bursaphelenchus xylophilus TaxID=6326 RepID=A0A1I7SUG8_BURXY|nr:unnamed protein product [Bursaphelenchus xylophilus]CAG9107148.1 unnamed protein product [Bursaphelenchus xylophilus]